ncbi:MAG: helix-turn-helix transcriptional regulator [Chromatiaceae bacterium]|nr:helix-turn-helix transcriptional regulator [Chromatiaceae bacterium]MCF7993712.1 helix-turn-helix transcriptional regulator [Chromatiaceae bacterium]MCF8014931.1 helix-turn-helix transcriptional regulator [Chromatiaceae bacterium]
MKISLKNNVRTTMASRDITMWKDLAERLKSKQGYSITRTSLARQIEQDAPAYSLDLIEALCNELQCLPNDLFRIEITDASPEDVRNLTRRERPFEFGHIMEAESEGGSVGKAPRSTAETGSDFDDDDDELVGGRVSHLSAEKVKKQSK